MKGSLAQNIEYCSKEYKKNPKTYFFRSGNAPSLPDRSGARMDIKNLLSKYNSYGEILLNEPGALVSCRNIVIDYFRLKAAQDHTLRNTRVLWFYGETGSGKTRSARQFMEDTCPGDWFFKSGSVEWFDGYNGQRGLLLDEFRRQQTTQQQGLAWLLKLTDRDKIMLPVKGGMVLFVAEIIIITCNVSPVEMFTYNREVYGGGREDVVDEHVDQLIRRIERIIKFNHDKQLGVRTHTDLTDTIYREVGLDPRAPRNDAAEPPRLAMELGFIP